MIIEDVIQGSPEWLALRAGVPSASSFDKLVTMKGEPSKQAEKYLLQLAGEALTGEKTETFQSDAMARGIELESEARNYYELTTHETVSQVGLCFADDDRRYACSPDGLVGEVGLVEIKCPLLSTQVGYLLEGKFPSTYFQQVQGQLLVTGREWCDFISYYPSPKIKPFIIRVERDEKFITKLKEQLEAFCDELDKTVKKLKELNK